MPITLGCPSCGKRFRARDESAGKRVKCPYCQAAVPVPSAEDAQHASAPTEVVPAAPPAAPFVPPPPSRPAASPPAAEPALFDIVGRPTSPPPPAELGDWGTSPPPAPAADPAGFDFPDAPAPVTTRPTPGRPSGGPRPSSAMMNIDDAPEPVPGRPVRGGKADRDDKPTRRDRDDRRGRPAEPAKSPEEIAAQGWRKVSGGLFWVLFGVMWFALPAFAEFGKAVYERATGEEISRGPGMVKISGFINDDSDNDAIQLSKRDELNTLAYGVPLLIGGFMVILGRLGCSSAPKASGAAGQFLLSSLFALIALFSLIAYLLSLKMGFYELRGYTGVTAVVAGGLSEVWFLLALGGIGGALKRPRVIRAVGFYVLVLGLAVLLANDGGAWDAYRRYGQPKPRSGDWVMFEEALRMIGWLLVVGIAWRTVRVGRSAVREWLEQYDEEHPAAKVA